MLRELHWDPVGPTVANEMLQDQVVFKITVGGKEMSTKNLGPALHISSFNKKTKYSWTSKPTRLMVWNVSVSGCVEFETAVVTLDKQLRCLSGTE